MTTRAVGAMGAGCGRSVLLQLGVTVGVFGALGVCVTLAAIVPLPSGADRSLLFLCAFVGGIMASLAVGLSIPVVILIRRARQLDAAFAPLGIAGQAHLMNGRQYHGSFGGRRLTAYFYRGPTFDLYLSGALNTRLGISRSDRFSAALAGMLGHTAMRLNDPQLEGLTAYALDEGWSHRLLAETPVRRSLLRLLDQAAPGAGAFEVRQVHLQPEAALLRLVYTRTESINAENVRAWLGDLQSILRSAEELPAAQVTAQLTPLERTVHTNRNALNGPALLIVLVFVGGMLVIGLAFTAVMLFLLAA